MSQRGSIRHKYGIDSNGCNDCLLSWCCGCCTLIQEDKEVRSQDERGPMMQQGYGAPNGGQQMVYGQPPQQQIYGDQKTGMQQ